ncbi:hypothetical protein WA158_003569 [Blastocystis sp. Blastoise]
MLIISGIATGCCFILAIICIFVSGSFSFDVEKTTYWFSVSYFFWMMFAASLCFLILSSIVKCGVDCCNGFTIFYCIVGIIAALVLIFSFSSVSTYWNTMDDMSTDAMQNKTLSIEYTLVTYARKDKGYIEAYKALSVESNCCGSVFASSACEGDLTSVTTCYEPIAKISFLLFLFIKLYIYLLVAGYYSFAVILSVIGCIIYLLYSIMACMFFCTKKEQRLANYPTSTAPSRV